MRVRTGLALALLLAASSALARPQAQPAPQSAPQAAAFTFEKVMIPMRDGARLQTVIMRPVGKSGPLPILLQRTPYGVPDAPPPQTPRTMQYMADDGYILVFQNMRGRFKSDGKFTMSMELAPAGSKAVDEATDAYDSIDWLVKRVPANNGRVGMWGVSYPGYAAAIALARPHPALKAVSPQAAWNDWWLNDDLHRHGAMRLTYATDWLYSLQHNKENAEFPYGSGFVDSYDFFLKLGPVSNLDSRYMRGTVPMLTAMIAHPDYDDHWRRQHWTDRLGRTTVPTLHVAGFWDQEDPSGSWKIYEQMEQDDPDGLNLMVAGPWNHGSWRSPGDRLGNIPMGVESGTEFRRDVEAPFFRYWLHGKGAQPRFEAKMFQSGSWQWRDYAQWPPKPREMRNLYLHTDGSLSFTAPGDRACRDYVSDPASPVPFRARPISRTYPSPEWQWWEAADQRFVDGRPDVLTYVSAPLESDLTVTGAIAARLMAATSGTDADMVVKLIDVFPDDYEPVPADYLKTLNGYQLPVAMEVRRGRWLDGNAVAKPLVADQVRAWDVPLRDHDHVFRKGHRLMVQVQSTWFPVIDRNPQTFVPNIYTAKASDFRKATHRVCGGSYVALPVM